MREIKITRWTEKQQDGQEVPGNLMAVLSVILNIVDPQKLPRGLDNFRIFSRLTKAFDEAEKANVLKLEEVDYMLLKDIIEKNIPGNWGANLNISEAIGLFLDAKSTN